MYPKEINKVSIKRVILHLVLTRSVELEASLVIVHVRVTGAAGSGKGIGGNFEIV